MLEATTGFPLLTLFTFTPVLGMLAILLLPSKRADIIKTVAAAAAAVPALLGVYVLFVFKDSGQLQYRESFLWIDGLNVYYALGIDGISAPMIVLSGLVGFIAVVASWGIEKQIKGYFALILLLLTGMNGVFCALDFFLFYVFWELMLLPMYFLIGVWGGPNRVYAAIKFFLYTMAGSVLMLVVLLATWYWSDGGYANLDRPAELAALNQSKEALVKRRADACARLEVAGGADLRSIPLALKRNILTAHGLALTADSDKQLKLAQELARQTNQLERMANAEVLLLNQQLAAPGAEREELEKQKANLLFTLEEDKSMLLDSIQLTRTFSFPELKERYGLFLGTFNFLGYTTDFAALMFVFLFVAFAIKVPVFPFHTWLPWAHVEAPTAITVILAGILLKMGVYGFFRISYPLFPTMAIAFAVPLAALGVFNILYGACCAMAQDDMKKLVAYSSVSHMGFCMLGMAALTQWGMTGAILQMFNHGTSTSMMFLLVGVIYDRAHHRDINKFGGLAHTLPVYTGMMTLALFASMGLPGLSGFISEILVFLGAFRSTLGMHSPPGFSFQTLTVLATLGVVLTAGYLLWMMQRVFFGPLNEKYKDLLDLNGRELFTLAPLAVLVVAFGVYPQPLINMTQKSTSDLQAFVLKSKGLSSTEKATVAGARPLARSATASARPPAPAAGQAGQEPAPVKKPPARAPGPLGISVAEGG